MILGPWAREDYEYNHMEPNVLEQVFVYLGQGLFIDNITELTGLSERQVYRCYYELNQDPNALRRFRTLQKHHRALQCKGFVCDVCGRAVDPDPNTWCLMDLHHVDQARKTNKMSWHFSNSSWDRIAIELENVQLVCSQEHRLAHQLYPNEEYLLITPELLSDYWSILHPDGPALPS